MVKALEHILGTQYQLIKNRPHTAKNHPEDQIQPQRIDRRVGQFPYFDDRRFTVENAENNARHDHAGKDGFDRDKVIAKLRTHLLDDKQNARQRCVEGS